MNLALEMMNSALEMMNFAFKNDELCVNNDDTGGCRADAVYRINSSF